MSGVRGASELCSVTEVTAAAAASAGSGGSGNFSSPRSWTIFNAVLRYI